MMPGVSSRLRRSLTLAGTLLLVTSGVGRAELVPSGWAPGGVPSAPTAVLLRSDREGAAKNCGENAALLVRVGQPRLLGGWSNAVGDALIAKGWSVHDLQLSGSLRAAALQDQLAAAAARCDARTILVASYGNAITPTRRAARRVRMSGHTRMTVIAEVPAGTRHVAWRRSARPFLRGLRSWPTPSIDDALAGIPQEGTRLGAAKAPVVMETFIEMQCSFCREYELQVLPRLVARYVRSGELQMRARVVSFLGSDSQRGARLVLAAGLQDRLWNATASSFERQGPENSGYVTDPFLREIAADAGLDVERAMADRESDPVRAALQRAQQRFRRAGLTGAPSFLIGPANGPLHLASGNYFHPRVIEGAIQRAQRAAHAHKTPK
jgi:protein-disulfide isomerase